MKDNKGITLTALAITIIILLILASITVFYAKESIDKANLENLKTNMLLMKAKAKEYCEEANFKLGTGDIPKDDQKLQEYLKPGINYLKNQNGEDKERPVFSEITTYGSYVEYKEFVTQLKLDDLKVMGLKDVEKPEKYLIAFNISENKVEIYYTDGYEVNGTIYHSLTELENIKD